MKKFFSVLFSRTFVISFLATLCVAAISLAVMAVLDDARSLPPQGFANSLPPRSLWEPAVPEEEPEPEWPENTMFSVLTGERIYEGYARRRPLAAVVNNIRASLPQSGIASADIVYEVLAEGDVTRFVAIFQSYIPETIGSIRSARDYFIDFAWNHDAVFIFHGSSPGGQNRIRQTAITHLDGGRLEGRVFWRDRSFPEWAANSGQRSLEHSSFTGRERIQAHFEEAEIRPYMNPDPAFGFIFGKPHVPVIGAAHRITVPFSRNYTRTFIFDEEQNLYWLENPQGPHRDAITAEQVSVTNVLIKFAHMTVIDGVGRRNVTTIGEGRGYLATGGEYFPVRWEKTSHTAPASWTFEDGTPLVLPPGRTWICVFQTGGGILFEGAPEPDEIEIDE